jgi:hypothetical protein
VSEYYNQLGSMRECKKYWLIAVSSFFSVGLAFGNKLALSINDADVRGALSHHISTFSCLGRYTQKNNLMADE